MSIASITTIAEKYNVDVRTIIEVGARDCTDTARLHAAYPDADIYTFECNPTTLPMCREAVSRMGDRVHLIEKAVANKNGPIKFWQIDTEKTITSWADGNPGASSLFQASGKYPVETYVQKPIMVPAIRLASFIRQRKIKKIDLLWLDIQGAELLALQSLGKLISTVGIIQAEVEFIEMYRRQPLFDDVKKFMEENGFFLECITDSCQFFGDATFVNGGCR